MTSGRCSRCASPDPLHHVHAAGGASRALCSACLAFLQARGAAAADEGAREAARLREVLRALERFEQDLRAQPVATRPRPHPRSRGRFRTTA